MIIGVLNEPAFENRVSLLPDSSAVLIKKGIEVWVEKGAGLKASCSDSDYQSAGVRLCSAEEILASSDIILSLHPPSGDLTAAAGKVMIGMFQPLFNAGLMQQWADTKLTGFSLDMLPRTTRAQAMDVLSSQANIAGYKAILVAANCFPHYFPMFMTAAGSIPPAKVLILGAGVAGLQAIATARRLGAIVEVFDTRPSVKEEVLSLGGKFIEVEGAADPSAAGGYAVEQSESFLERQKAKIAESVAKADIVITTAQIPGKPAPVLITGSMIEAMKKGSVIVDLASSTGGNTELTRNNETVLHNGVQIIGNSLLASTMPFDASKLYGRNLLNFLQLLIGKDNKLSLNFEDDLVRGSCIVHAGLVVHEKVKSLKAGQ